MKIVNKKGIAPHNYKSGELILGKYRFIDISIMILAVFLFAFVLLLSMFLIKFNLIFIMIFGLFIPGILIGLVQPIPNYHNYLEFIRLIILFQKKDKFFSSLIETKEKTKSATLHFRKEKKKNDK